MRRNIDKIKPAVDKRVLLFLAGFMWLGVGTMLLVLSYSWLNAFRVSGSFLFEGIGLAAALVEGKRCVFSFLTWKSYIMVALMIALGALLRHSPIPKPYLSMLYTGIGFALVLSSVRYLRVLLSQFRNTHG
jgi:hypothetical protein